MLALNRTTHTGNPEGGMPKPGWHARAEDAGMLLQHAACRRKGMAALGLTMPPRPRCRFP